jgi:uncharacterized DUF497 family protein
VRYEFRWNRWNVDHIDEHGVTSAEAEFVVENPLLGHSERIGDGKYLAVGQTPFGRYIQVIFIFDPATIIYVLHARSLTETERRRLRKRRRRRGD